MFDDANPNQRELNLLRAKVLDLSAWRDQVRLAWEKWREADKTCERYEKLRNLEALMTSTGAAERDKG